MLSKSSARRFFLFGTTIFSLVFLWLTVDTVRQVPKRSNVDKMSPQVLRGHDLWTDNNCMGCHTLLGEGAYYAPELTKVVERRGKDWIALFLKDPQAMYPGQRKMVQYNFKDDQIQDLIAFFEWVGNIDTNGFPPKPDLVTVPASNSASLVNANPHASPAADSQPPPPIFKSVCSACHALGGSGGAVGPALDGVAKRYTPEKLEQWLADPQAVKPGTAMPNLNLSPEVRGQLVEFLMRQN